MRQEFGAADRTSKQWEPLPGVLQAAHPEASLQSTAQLRSVLFVITGSKLVSSIDFIFWSMVFAWLFPNGDGVFGTEQECPIYIDEWSVYFLFCQRRVAVFMDLRDITF